MADDYATKGHDQHPPFDQELLKIDHTAFKVAKKVLILAARIMPLHPEMGKHERKKSSIPTAEHGVGDLAPPLPVGTAEIYTVWAPPCMDSNSCW